MERPQSEQCDRTNEITASEAELPQAADLKNSNDLSYQLEDVPPWHVCFTLGFQQFLLMFSGAVAIPLLIGPLLCMEPTDVARGYLAANVLLLAGISTLMQILIGVRLPIVQGPSWTFLSPILAVMALPQWKCPESRVQNITNNSLPLHTDGESHYSQPLWQSRLAEVSGAILVASIFQTLLGLTGAVGALMRIISPITVLSTITVLGIGFFKSFQNMAAQNWAISMTTLALVVLFSQYLRNVSVPVRNFRTGKTTRAYIFKLFPILFGILISWAFCAILTMLDIFDVDNPARTDAKLQLVYDSVWFRVPWPGQWGAPSFSVGAVLGMMAASLASIIESIGDYHAAATIAGVPPPPVHAINRGIAIEGVGCFIHSIFGTGVAATSYSGNIGAIGMTKVASRRVIVWASFLMIACGLTSKLGALFMTIPDCVYVGAFIPLFSMIAGMGLSMMQQVNMKSQRNLFIIGFSILFALILPDFMINNPDRLKTGSDVFDQVLFVLLSTGISVAGTVACFLDNTVPKDLDHQDTRPDSLSKSRRKSAEAPCAGDKALSAYDLPFGMELINRTAWTRWVPFLPPYKGLPSWRTAFRTGSQDEATEMQPDHC